MNLNRNNITVCHLTSAHPDGDSRIFYKSCVSAAKAGFRTYCIVPNATSRTELGVEIIGFPTEHSSRVKRFIGTVNTVLEKACALKADIYHLHDPELLLVAKKLKKRTGAAIIFDSHEDVPKQIMDKIWIPKWIRGFVSYAYETFEKRACIKIDAVISVTPLICQRFKRIQPRVVLVANFPDLNEFDFSNAQIVASQPRSFAYIGGISRTRGIVELILALEHLDAQLHLAGWFESEALEQELRALPSWKKVKFYGKVDRKGVQEILARAQVGVVTLWPTASYKEAYPIKMFEYMAAELPVLASDFPMWRELIEPYKCAEFVDPQNPTAIANKLDQMFKSPELIEMGKRGRIGIQKDINWEQEAAKLVALYDELAQT